MGMHSPRSHRVAVVALFFAVVTVLEVGPAPPVRAWGNGADDPEAYGTHDWILVHALDAVDDQVGWVCRGAALHATDDPDTKEGIDHASGTWWHVWDEWRDTWGGAPEAVDVWFARIQSRLEQDRECSASKALGIMAHLVGDIAQPMHTDGSSDLEDSIHSDYEVDVDRRTGPGNDEYGSDFDGIHSADAYRLSLRVARQAHRSYEALVTSYSQHGYNRRVARITQRQLERAVNALADLVAALEP